MKITYLLLLAFLLSSLTVSPSTTQAGTQPVEKEWTFITFLNGHNSLDKAGYRNIAEMEKVGSTDEINVVVQWASLKASKTKRIYIKQGSFDTIEELPRVDMGDAKNFVEFVNWAVKNYPAKHYFIDLWNHGSGWHFRANKISLSQAYRPYDISVDDTTGNSISTEDLGKSVQLIAQNIGHKIDIYGSDACLMAMAEVMGEVKNSVEVFVGSEEVEPDNGWPYGDLFRRWSATPTATAADVAKILVDEYIKSYSGGTYGNDDGTLSAVDLTKFDGFESDFKQFTQYLSRLDQKTFSHVMRIAKSTQTFASSDYADLGDFLRLLKNDSNSFDVDEISHLEASLNSILIANGDTPSYKLAKGISFWLPTDSDDWKDYHERYRGLEFDSSTGWSQMVERIFTK